MPNFLLARLDMCGNKAGWLTITSAGLQNAYGS
jgi:hypothetical protein